MSGNLLAVFSHQPIDDSIAAIVAEHGIAAARPYSLAVRIGDGPPAQFSHLTLVQTEDAFAGTLDVGDVAWRCSYLEGGPMMLPDRLYLNFSRPPAAMSFEEYGDWYAEHQAINIANTATLRQGWRYRLLDVDTDPGAGPGPSHLAMYELTDDVTQMGSDLAAATRAGRVELPDWFSRSASLAATALAPPTVR